ncbi:hypothetical protein ACFL21_03630 [Patescibacteria group bacterium]
MSTLDPKTGKPKKSLKSVIFLIFGIIVGMQILGGVIGAIASGEPGIIIGLLGSLPIWIIIIVSISKITNKTTKTIKEAQQSQKAMNQMDTLLKGSQFDVIKNLVLGGKLEILNKILGPEKWNEIKKSIQNGQYQEVTRIINQNKAVTPTTNIPKTTTTPKIDHSKTNIPITADSNATPNQNFNPSVGNDTLRIVILIVVLLVMAGVGILFFMGNLKINF